MKENIKYFLRPGDRGFDYERHVLNGFGLTTGIMRPEASCPDPKYFINNHRLI